MGDRFLGPEAALWTETVPEHRVMAKVLPRLTAFAECAWSSAERNYGDYQRRKSLLRGAGYFEEF